MGENDQPLNDDEATEIIRCIVHQEHLLLKDILDQTSIDVTQIRDEMGYSLVHLAAYNNTEKCMEHLINHILRGSNKILMQYYHAAA